MNYKSKCRQTALAALIVSGAIQHASGQYLPADVRGTSRHAVVAVKTQNTALPELPSSQALDQPAVALTADEAGQSAAGNVAQLQQMIRNSTLVELRTTYNGSYGTSILFDAQEMTYYVALFSAKEFLACDQDSGRNPRRSDLQGFRAPDAAVSGD